MKAVFIGTVHFSHEILTEILDQNLIEIVGIVTKASSQFNSDFCSLETIARQKNIALYYANNSQAFENATNWIASLSPDVIYCLGWSYLVSQNLLALPRHGVIGYHPTALPKHRGRHPIIWTLVHGLPQTASTFLKLDEGVDSGDILSQVYLEVDYKDTASSLYEKLLKLAKKQIREINEKLIRDELKSIKQDNTQATYWEKRTKMDGIIHWRSRSFQIYNLIRALSHPYPGAICLYQNTEIPIWNAEELRVGSFCEKPGKVLASQAQYIDVACQEGAIRILKHEFGNKLPQVGEFL